MPQLLSPQEVAGFAADLDRLAGDPAVRADERTIVEKRSQQVRSIFEVQALSDELAALVADDISISLTENFARNGCLMIMPGSHRTFVSCVGETPDDHYEESLREQETGTPDPVGLTALADRHGISMLTGAAGSATLFDSTCMHGSSNNITPYPRSNVFVVFNSVENGLRAPFAAPSPRPSHVAARTITPV